MTPNATVCCANCTHDSKPRHMAPCPDCYRNGRLKYFQPVDKSAKPLKASERHE